MILFNINETAVSLEWDEVCGVPTIKHHESIREAIKSTMNNSSWNIGRITSDDATHHMKIEWESSGGHFGLSIVSVDEESVINAFRNEISWKYDKEHFLELMEEVIIDKKSIIDPYDKWIKELDDKLIKLMGMPSSDLIDFCYMSYYNDGISQDICISDMLITNYPLYAIE